MALNETLIKKIKEKVPENSSEYRAILEMLASVDEGKYLKSVVTKIINKIPR